MNNTKTGSSNITTKIRSSLVLKLNTRMVLRLLSAFLAINVLIIIMGTFVIFWNAEEGVKAVIDMVELTPLDSKLINRNIGKYIVSEDIEVQDGFQLPEIIERYLPNGDTWKRSIGPEVKGESKFIEELESTRYTVTTNINGKPYEIVYLLGYDLKLLLKIFTIILVFQLIILIVEIIKGSKDIRRTLKPLYDLTETAKSLNQEVSSLGIKTRDDKIKDLAGVISSIDANKLDKRISIDTSQEELKELAYAINDMLNRINASYQSQVRFVSDASHELRTPISVIQGYVNLLDRWGKRDEKTMQESIDAIKSETHHMKELVEQLLFLARGDNETIQLHREDFDVCHVVEEIGREAEMIDPNHNFHMELQGPVYINADKQLVKQAIRILVDNSIKYTPEGGRINLRVNTENDSAFITVQDNGIGITPENIPHIFDRFYRSDESRARKTGGSGLGLSIAKWIIEKHGAHFEVLSRVNIGTRITIVMSKTEVTCNEAKDDYDNDNDE